MVQGRAVTAGGARSAARQQYVVLGGGTAGWMCAAVLAKLFGQGDYHIVLVESEQIGTVGVGEATIPPILDLLDLLDIPLGDFVARTEATFKLGIEFDGWRQDGKQYLHPFGTIGHQLGPVPFHHYWLRELAGKSGLGVSLEAYSPTAQLARAGLVAQPTRGSNSPLDAVRFALHFDAAAAAAYLRSHAEKLGVERVAGTVSSVETDIAVGRISALVLEDGRRCSADFVFDCSGFAARAICALTGHDWDDWSRWLPCDSAIVAATQSAGSIRTYTRAVANETGWQWNIPLQSRDGNGRVYASAYCTDAEAERSFLTSLPAAPSSEPRLLRFRTGRRTRPWAGNCLAIGLSAGFMEPLESTSIHLAQSGLLRFLAYIGCEGSEDQARQKYNRETESEWRAIRDFLILHYAANERIGEPFWDDRRTMPLPTSLEEKIALYREDGRILPTAGDLFGESNWLAILVGQMPPPMRQHPLAGLMPVSEIEDKLGRLAATVGSVVQAGVPHREFIEKTIGAGDIARSRTAH